MAIDLFGLIADRYDHVFRYEGPAELLAALQPEAGDRILDVGGGTGRVSGMFEPGLDTLLVDPSAGMLREAAGKGLRSACAVAEHLPFADAGFARIILVDALHHVDSQDRTASELLRVLAPGGRLVIDEPDIDRIVVKVIALFERLLGMNSRFLSRMHAMTLFEQAGAASVQAHLTKGASYRLVVMRGDPAACLEATDAS